MSDLVGEAHWQRLDPRMLLVHPVKEFTKYLPALVIFFLAGSASGGGRWWQVVGVLVPVLLGLMRYLTTSFRIADGRVELRRGLLTRHVLSTPLDRVRTVDLTASPIHRVLGLTTVRIGTGTASKSEDDRIDLDGLLADRARRLREGLLRVAPTTDPDSPAQPPERVVLRLDPTWVRFAPFTSTGLVAGLGVLGVATQLVRPLRGAGRFDLGGLTDGAATVTLWVAVPLLVLGSVAFVSLLAVGGYLLTNWGFTLSHSGTAWHLRRGLLTTRETSLDDERVRGLTVAEPIGLRLVRGARLSAIVTGLGSGQQGSSILVPPAPRAVVDGVAREVLGTAAPIDSELVSHGPRARSRRFTRALGPALATSAAVVLIVLATDLPAGFLAAAVLAPAVALALAVDRSRSLGHAFVEGYVVARAGSLGRRREALATDGVIGWTFHATWFQRRAGLTSLVATTAGGRQSVTVLDVPEAAALALAATATPGLVAQFMS